LVFHFLSWKRNEAAVSCRASGSALSSDFLIGLSMPSPCLWAVPALYHPLYQHGLQMLYWASPPRLCSSVSKP